MFDDQATAPTDTAYEILNPNGAADLVLLCDHASRDLPDAYGTLGLEDSLLWRHIAWDIGAADVTRRLSRLLDAPAILSRYSRLLVDCNRRLEDPSSMPESSDGIAIPGNCGLNADERGRRAEHYYWPYHHAVDRLIEGVAARGPTPAIISMHSFTPIMEGFERPWHVGILWARDPRIPVPLMTELRRNRSLVVGENQPYTAHSPFGFSINRHAEEPGRPHVLIEIRQDLIDTHHGAEAWANLLAAALATVVREGAPFATERY